MFGQEAKLAALINRDPPQVPNEQALVAELRAKLGPGADPGKLLFQIRSARGKTHWAVNSYLREVMTSSTPGHEDFQPSRPARTPLPTPPPAVAVAVAAAAAEGVPSDSVAAATAGAAQFDGGGATIAIATAVSDADAESNLPICGHSEPPGLATTGCSRGQRHSSLIQPDATAIGMSAEPVSGSDGDGGSSTGSSICGGFSCLGAPSLDSLPVSLLEAVFRHLDYRSLCAAAMASKTMSVAASSESLWSSLYASRWGRVVFPTEPHLGPMGLGAALGQGVGPGEGPGAGQGFGGRSGSLAGVQTATSAVVAGAAAAVAAARGGGRGAAMPAAEIAASGAAGAGGQAAAWGLSSLLLQWRSAPPRCLRQQQHETLVLDPSTDPVPDLGADRQNPSHLVSCSLADGNSSSNRDDAVAGRCTGPPGQLPVVSEVSASGDLTGNSSLPSIDGWAPLGHSLSVPPPQQQQQQQQKQDLQQQSLQGPSALPSPPTATAPSLAAAAAPSCKGLPTRCDTQLCEQFDDALNPTGRLRETAAPSYAPGAAAAVAATSLPSWSLETAAPAAAIGAHFAAEAEGQTLRALQEGWGSDVVRCGAGFCGGTEEEVSEHEDVIGHHRRVDNADGGRHADVHDGGGGGNGHIAALAAAAATAAAAPTAGRATAAACGKSSAATVVTTAVGGGRVDGVVVPLRPEQGSAFRSLYQRQMCFLNSLRCPRCGGGAIVPIVYGFPSPKLMEGMRERRLILGGDHLIENCHVWGCNRCGASFRHFPYDGCENWVAELARPQPQRPSHLPHYTYEL
ncbi:hypothetical protein Vretimale_11837 [Volvox reticuliferus]|uniref:F-box domain-containing protein n=1 Tax=Volvox reticuliferus TaxID=1737510 RepID=A0A8J4LSG1_9CHLO|nr:hypothetical protein Vretifemale_11386 [Volvox reticuliferus]GIM07766.1 hypothetical protein Vretimale_11837 [Volvox reticuliferus]